MRAELRIGDRSHDAIQYKTSPNHDTYLSSFVAKNICNI
jgi:hypothetical protein